MPSIQDTAYPHFKKNITKRELEEIYTPTADEILFIHETITDTTARLYLLIILKTFQRLGYFVLIKNRGLTINGTKNGGKDFFTSAKPLLEPTLNHIAQHM